MKKEVRFITDFATMKKGDVKMYDSMLASQLVNVDKVAEYVVEFEKPKATKKAK
jgi:hypothetical protein